MVTVIGVPGVPVSKNMQVFKGALSQNISISLNSQNIFFVSQETQNNGLFLLRIAILVC